MTLGRYLRTARELAFMSQRKAATAAAISCAYLSQLEQGKTTEPSPRILYRLAEVYACPYTDLMRLAGYEMPAGPPPDVSRLVESITEDEREVLLAYLSWYRWYQQKRQGKP